MKTIYQEEFDQARAVLASDEGVLAWSAHEYQAFTYVKPYVGLVFYPHRTTAGNHHIRVRDQGSIDKKEADRLMQLLDESILGCTFMRKRS